MAPANLYFAYGSNLNFEDWRAQHPELPDPASALEFVTTAYLPDLEIVFRYHSRKRGGGALDVVERIGQSVPGVVFRVLSGWEALDAKEGAPHRYERLPCTALTDGGDVLHVETYRVRRERHEGFVPPTTEYLEAVAAGLGCFGIGDAMLRHAAAGRPVPWTTDGVFVYGTLMRGESRHGIVARHGVEGCSLAEIRARLIDLGAYPGLILDGSRKPVRGELICVREVGSLIAALDDVEGFAGFGKAGSLYDRRLIRVQGERSEHLAWVYEYAGAETDGRIIGSGDWRAHRNGRP